jgi:hypothetical protein
MFARTDLTLRPWVPFEKGGPDADDHEFESSGVAVGIIEMVAGLLVLISPKWGNQVVAVWLAGIIFNLLSASPPVHYDIALRDFGLLLGALTLHRLATASGATTIVHELRRPMPRAA